VDPDSQGDSQTGDHGPDLKLTKVTSAVTRTEWRKTRKTRLGVNHSAKDFKNSTIKQLDYELEISIA